MTSSSSSASSSRQYNLPKGISFKPAQSGSEISSQICNDECKNFNPEVPAVTLQIDQGPTLSNVTAAHVAALCGNVTYLRKIVDSSSSDNSLRKYQDLSDNKRSLAEFACRGGHLKVLEFLLEVLGAAALTQPNGVGGCSGTPPLYMAVQSGSLECVQFLHDKCYSNNNNNNGNNSEEAHHHEHVVMPPAASSDLAFNYRTSDDGVDLLMVAARFKHAEVLEYLLKLSIIDKEARMTSRGEKAARGGGGGGGTLLMGEATAFSVACGESNLRCVEILFSEGAHVGTLQEVTGVSKRSIQKVSEDEASSVVVVGQTNNNANHKNTNTSSANQNRQQQQQQQQQPKVVFRKFKGFPVLPQETITSAMMMQEKSGTELESSYVVELEKTRSRTNAPLHRACEHADGLDIVKFLIERAGFECDKNTRVGGFTPLYLAARYRNLATVTYLVDVARCDIDKVSLLEGVTTTTMSSGGGSTGGGGGGGGASPLYTCSYWNYPEMVEFLLSRNANSTLQHKEATPFIAAIARNSVAVVEALHKGGADTRSLYKNMTPLAYAKNEGRSEIVKYMEKADIGY